MPPRKADPFVRMTVTVPRKLVLRLRQQAESHDTSLSAFCRETLEHACPEKKRKLPGFTGAGASGRADVSERAEEFLGALARKRFKRGA